MYANSDCHIQTQSLPWRLFMSEYSFWITVNSPFLYWCLTANVSFSKRKRKDESRTDREWELAVCFSYKLIKSRETINLNFILARAPCLPQCCPGPPHLSWPRTDSSAGELSSRRPRWLCAQCRVPPDAGQGPVGPAVANPPSTPTAKPLHRTGPPATRQTLSEPRETLPAAAR